MSSDIALWSSLKKQYPRNDDASIHNDAKMILAWLKEQGVCFQGCSLLDIGCGTGALCLPIAQEGAHVTALDISYEMLKIINKESDAQNLEDFITLLHANWSAYKIEKPYDIVLASMTPAISSERDIKAMIDATNALGIFVGWKRYKKNTLLDVLLVAHNAPEERYNTSSEIKDVLVCLEKKGLPYNIHYFSTSWERTYSYEEAKSYAVTQLLQHKLFPDERKIDAILNDFKNEDGIIVSENKAEKGVILFSKCPLLKETSLVC